MRDICHEQELWFNSFGAQYPLSFRFNFSADYQMINDTLVKTAQ
jgi:hypothetical protein